MKKISIIFLLMASLSSHAQVKKWTLNECMKYAVENSPEIRKDKARNNIYHQTYLEAIGRLLPRVSAGTNANFNFGRGLDSETNTYTDINSFNNNYNLNGSVTLFDGLSNISRVKMEKVNKLLGKQQLQQDEDRVAYETLEAFLNTVYYEQMIILANEQLAESNQNLQQVQRMEELGIKGFPDVAELKAKQAADTYNLIRQQNLLTIGIILLKEKMNYPVEEDLEIDMPVIDDGYIAWDDNLSATAIYNQAIAYLPKALIASSSLTTKELAYQSAKGNLFPVISADAGYSTNFSRFMDGSEYSAFKDQLRDKRGYYVGFTLSVPLFSGFSRTANVKRSKADLIIAKTEQDEALYKIYSEIEQVVADLRGLVAEYDQARIQVEAMQAAHDMNQRKYIEGLISPLELHTSANRLLKARSDVLNARLRHETKKKMVDYYKGIPFITE